MAKVLDDSEWHDSLEKGYNISILSFLCRVDQLLSLPGNNCFSFLSRIYVWQKLKSLLSFNCFSVKRGTTKRKRQTNNVVSTAFSLSSRSRITLSAAKTILT
jgi:hypothetical protein